ILSHSIYEDVDLEHTDDSYHQLLPHGCRTRQIAIQREPLFPRSPWFIVAKDLWNKLDEFNRAALVLHEALYRIGVRNGLTDSVGVRYLVGMFFSENPDVFTDEEWVRGFLYSRIRNYELDGAVVPIFQGRFRPCGPGASLRCRTFSDYRPAALMFEDFRLAEVSYDLKEMVQVSPELWLQTKKLMFAWRESSATLLFEGIVVLRYPDGFDEFARFRFQGKVVPGKNIICGLYSRADVAESLGLTHYYCGSIDEAFLKMNISGISEVSPP
ncbi:MAG: hypothetical protein HC902_04770, partial [Calothrix sp. SM1_5_4]|nr:hypothetical protein [Calothrix sp. SM1_5_4]